MPLVRPLLGQEVLDCLILLLSAILDVSLRRQDRGVANELLSQDYIVGLFKEVRYLRCSEVVAHDFDFVVLEEPSELLSPLVSRISPRPGRKHFRGVRCTNGGLVSFDSIDCLLIKCDKASGGLLSRDVQLDAAIFVGSEVRDRAKGQTDSILYT